jgi:hypothetical protein
VLRSSADPSALRRAVHERLLSHRDAEVGVPVKARTRQNGRGADQDLPAAISRPSPSAISTLGVDRLDRVSWPGLRPAARVLDGALRDALCAAIHRGTNHVVGRTTSKTAKPVPLPETYQAERCQWRLAISADRSARQPGRLRSRR